MRVEVDRLFVSVRRMQVGIACLFVCLLVFLVSTRASLVTPSRAGGWGAVSDDDAESDAVGHAMLGAGGGFIACMYWSVVVSLCGCTSRL